MKIVLQNITYRSRNTEEHANQPLTEVDQWQKTEDDPFNGGMGNPTSVVAVERTLLACDMIMSLQE